MYHNGNLVDTKYYTLKEGSTIITLHADYVETLPDGNNLFTAVFEDGKAEVVLNVADVSTPMTVGPQTGDNNMNSLYMMMMISLAGIVVMNHNKKRNVN